MAKKAERSTGAEHAIDPEHADDARDFTEPERADAAKVEAGATKGAAKDAAGTREAAQGESADRDGKAAREAAEGASRAAGKAAEKAAEKAAKAERKAAKRARKAGREQGAGSGATPAAAPSVRAALRLPGGPVDLAAIDTRATPGFTGGRADALADVAAMAPRLADLQERLYAQAIAGGARRRVLLVIQGMDTSGKGGTVKHVIGQFNPSGCHIHAFKAPTAEELAHPFLWRVRREVPGPGLIGVFDRSHYEDVLIARVRELVPRATWSRRYAAVNRFEQALVSDEVTVVKVFLHISPDEQKERLLARLDNPDKHWKFDPADIDERAVWADYRTAYEAALERCASDAAPWYVVPADRKWYRNWAISRLLLETLTDLDPRFPAATFDVEAERRRLLET